MNLARREGRALPRCAACGLPHCLWPIESSSPICGQRKATPQFLHPGTKPSRRLRGTMRARRFMLSSRVERPFLKLGAQTLWQLFASTPDDLDVVTELESRAATGSWARSSTKPTKSLLSLLAVSERRLAWSLLAGTAKCSGSPSMPRRTLRRRSGSNQVIRRREC